MMEASSTLYFWTPIQTHWILHLCIHSGRTCAETRGLQNRQVHYNSNFLHFRWNAYFHSKQQSWL